MSVSRRTDRDRLRAGCACALPPPHPRRLTSLITTTSLKTQSWKDLAEMAKSKGLTGWHSMRKDDLVKALLKAAKKRERLRLAAAKSSKPQKSLRGGAMGRDNVHRDALRRDALRRNPIARPHPAPGKSHSGHSNGKV